VKTDKIPETELLQ